MKVISLGFATARSSIEPSPWLTKDHDDLMIPVPPALGDWDPAMGLSAERNVTLDLGVLRTETGLAPGSRLRLAGGWHCEGTRTREVTEVHDVLLTPDSARLELTLTVNVRGADVARELAFETRLVLVSSAPASELIAPRWPGAVVWEDLWPVQLEDADSRFPMEWADFESSIYRTEAAWALDWDPQDLECSTTGGLRLLINQKHERVAALLRDRSDSSEARLLWDALQVDIARQLITGAFSNADFVGDANAFDDGTLGATIRRMIGTYFPHESVAALKSLAERAPTQFETALQANLRTYHDK